MLERYTLLIQASYEKSQTKLSNEPWKDVEHRKPRSLCRLFKKALIYPRFITASVISEEIANHGDSLERKSIQMAIL